MNLKKRIGVFLLALLFTFTVCTSKPQEPKAELVLTASAIYLIACFLATSGIILVNQDLIVDIAERVAEKLSTVPDDFGTLIEPKPPEEGGDNEEKTYLKLTPEVKQLIIDSVNELPEESVIVNKVNNVSKPFFRENRHLHHSAVPKSSYSISFTLPHDVEEATIFLTDEYGQPFGGIFVDDELIGGQANFYDGFKAGDKLYFDVKALDDELTLDIYNNSQLLETVPNYTKSVYKRAEGLQIWISNIESWPQYRYDGDLMEQIEIEIPYNPEIKTDFNEDKLQETFPDNTIIKVPVETELPDVTENKPFDPQPDVDYEIEVPQPETKPELPDTKYPDEGVETDPDQIPDTEIPDEEDSSFWKRLLNPILEILKAIYEVVAYIFNLLLNILTSILDVIAYLMSLILDAIIDIYLFLAEQLSVLLSPIAEILADIFNFLLNLVESLLDGLADLMGDLFIPTINITKEFDFPDEITQIPKLNFERLFNINTRPIVYTFMFDMGNVQKEITIDFSKIDVLEDNKTLIRNIMSYCLLVGAVLGILNDLKPKRVMD